ncbi:MAG: ribosome hibernation-promoting factor, HPF/YfiA family [Candidatus Binataceae bacterium]
MPANSKSGQARTNKTTKRPVRARRKPRVETRVTVTFRHVAPTPALERYAERKLGSISKFLKRPAEAHVILSVDKYRQCGEVTVKSGRVMISAQEETKDLYSVIDLLTAKVQRLVKKHLEKLEARKVRALSTGEVLSASEEDESQSIDAHE